MQVWTDPMEKNCSVFAQN